MKKFLYFFLIISIISCDKDDPSKTTINSVKLVWSKAFGGSGTDAGLAITKTTDGGSIVVGYSGTADGDVSTDNGSGNGTYDLWAVKLDASGKKQWAKSFGGSGYDDAFAVIPTTDGGYAIAGSSGSDNGDVSNNLGSSDFWLVKLDASGNKQWAKSYGQESRDEARSILATSDGGYIVAGTSFNWNGAITGINTNHDILVLKLNSSGTLEWSKTFGGSLTDIMTSMIATTNGGYVITGYTYSNDGDFTSNFGNSDNFVIKLDASCTKQWSKTYGGSDYDLGSSIITTADGGYAITGETRSTDGDVSGNHGDFDGWVLKLDAFGTKQWSKTFGGSAYDLGYSLAATSSGQYIVSGYVESTDGDVTDNHGKGDGFIVAFDASGNKLTAKTFGGSGWDEIHQLIIAADGKYVLTAGISDSTDGDVSGNHGNGDCWVMQLKF